MCLLCTENKGRTREENGQSKSANSQSKFSVKKGILEDQIRYSSLTTVTRGLIVDVMNALVVQYLKSESEPMNEIIILKEYIALLAACTSS